MDESINALKASYTLFMKQMKEKNSLGSGIGKDEIEKILSLSQQVLEQVSFLVKKAYELSR